MTNLLKTDTVTRPLKSLRIYNVVGHVKKGRFVIDPFFKGGFLIEKGSLRNGPFLGSIF